MAVRVTVDAQNAGLALPHKLWPSDSGTDKHAEKCPGVCTTRYSHFECTAAIPLHYPPPKHTPSLLDAPKEINEGDSGLLNLARILITAFLSITWLVRAISC
jgi:hypothetical protein